MAAQAAVRTVTCTSRRSNISSLYRFVVAGARLWSAAVLPDREACAPNYFFSEAIWMRRTRVCGFRMLGAKAALRVLCNSSTVRPAALILPASGI